MKKDNDKWFPDRLLWKRWAHSLMKQSISCLSASCTSMAIKINWCLSWNLLYLRILGTALSFVTTFIGQLMTFESHCFSRWVTNHHINNKDLLLLGHVEISSKWNFLHKGIPLFFPYNVPTLLNEDIYDISDGVMCDYPLTAKRAMN
jgi:hypothetical protein